MRIFRRRRRAPRRDDYMTASQHFQEAERLTWVIDDVIQSGAKRSLGELIALARLHLELARASGGGGPIRPQVPPEVPRSR